MPPVQHERRTESGTESMGIPKADSLPADLNDKTSDMKTDDGNSGNGSSRNDRSAAYDSFVVSQEEYARRQKRKKLIIVVKVLFEVLEQEEDPDTRQRAQKVIRRCIRKNRENDPNHASLVDSIIFYLKREVGQETWRKTATRIKTYVLAHSMKSFTI
mmetsp:Transcript_12549/g.23564  ORF Transcript_12549/g.23564 Transcript_12549/m.23564 type:complete len:158 (-) Transcript_12549:163-636(-)|eukprot:CAMPEP_0197451372 /NCGR_PEP_ID=MMETSP1175-20131217/28599_1 /TAXON_ID=1003142 /ORGANISM="Triceratium dubium, Strain CCMP147" /LENGTH=157 /DNA_ID=CAMNT_0042984071 /DNA_START=78 /DNA_END=551 /DNA_ORIENTATION=-